MRARGLVGIARLGVMMMMVVHTLGLSGGLLLKRRRIDAIVLEDLVYGVLNHRIQV